MKKFLPYFIVLVVVGGALFFTHSDEYIAPQVIESKEVRVNQIITSDSFQEEIKKEAEKRYYKEQLNEAKDKLLQLDKEGFTSQSSVQALISFLEAHNPSLVAHAAEIATMPRYVEAVAIASHETSMCTTGVAKSLNNCGGIKAPSGEFKKYPSKLDSLKDISNLLQKPQYKDKSIAAMNGTYCVSDQGKCPNWTERIDQSVIALLSK